MDKANKPERADFQRNDCQDTMKGDVRKRDNYKVWPVGYSCDFFWCWVWPDGKGLWTIADVKERHEEKYGQEENEWQQKQREQN